MTLLQTDFLPNKSETFQALRFMLQDVGLQTGRVNAGDYKVTQHSTPNMTVDVAAGSAWIIGTTAARQGIYHQVNDATYNLGNFANSDPTNPRVDQVILIVNDSSIGGGSDNPQFSIVQGAPTGGATLDNRSGAVLDATINTTYRNSWVRWADVLIPAGSASVVNANIRDRGPWARRLFSRNTRQNSGSNITIASATSANLDALLLYPRVEVTSGAVLKLSLIAHLNIAAGDQARFTPWVDGVIWTDPATGNNPILDWLAPSAAITVPAVVPFFLPGLAAGSHQIGVAWNRASGTGTEIIYAAGASDRVDVLVEELPPSANNT